MTGIFEVCEVDLDYTPSSLKEFEGTKDDSNPFGILSRGNLIPKNEKKEESIICEFIRGDTKGSIRLFLYPDGTALGRMETSDKKSYLKGMYKKHSKKKISIYGIWAGDPLYKEKVYFVIKLGY